MSERGIGRTTVVHAVTFGMLAVNGGHAGHAAAGTGNREGPIMVGIEGEIVINRPVEEVFDFVADERNEPRFNPRMLRADKLSPGRSAGTRFRAEIETMRRTSEMTIQCTGYERPRRLASSTQLATMDIDGALTFDPVAGGTRMRWSWDIQPRGLLRLMGPWSRAWASARSGRSGPASSATWRGPAPRMPRTHDPYVRSEARRDRPQRSDRRGS
jgi:carbon monoxide dehydrogenase subunit G